MALDPGGGTGWAVWSGDRDKAWDPDSVEMGVLSEEDHHHHLDCLLRDKLTCMVPPPITVHIEGIHASPYIRAARRDAHLVVERFDHTDNRAADLISNEYIGVAKGFAQKFNVPLKLVSRSNKDVTYLKGKNLKDFGLWHESKDARDAARHLVWYLIFEMRYQSSLYYRRVHGG
jgi:hypothetical protein